LRKVKKEGDAVIKLGVNERGVRAVEKSRVFLILQRSRIDRKQDLETDKIRSDMESVESKITPRLLADSAGVIVTLEGIRRKGSEILDS